MEPGIEATACACELLYVYVYVTNYYLIIILVLRARPSLGFSPTLLTGRSQYVKLGNHNSSSTSVTTGVSQGSVLGPLLFTIIHVLLPPSLLHTASHNSSMQTIPNSILLFPLTIAPLPS